MSNPLAKEFNFFSLIRFTSPTIIMMVFMSMYSMVDGAFVSRFVGTTALSAVNIAFPLLSIVVALGVMLGTGGSAVVATMMGNDDNKKAQQSFTFLVLVGVGLGFLVLVLGFVFLDPLVRLLGANEAVYEYCRDYIRFLLPFSPLYMLQMMFQTFFVTAGKPMVGLSLTVVGGVANVLLDYLFIVPLDMNVAGAALATGIGASIPGLAGLFYFMFHRRGSLFFVKPQWSGRVLWTSCSNGSSEMISNLAAAVTTFLFNITMMRLIGEDGVAAITIVLYTQFLLTAVYLGYSSGVAPVISYNHGAGNTTRLRSLFRNSLKFIVIGSFLTFVVALLLSDSLVSIFAKDNPHVYALAHNGFVLFSASYLLMGFNIFASAMFTAFSDGPVSATISFLRTFVLLIASVLLLPQVMGLNGVWLSVPLAELLTLAISLTFVIRLRKKYQYA